MKRKMTALLIVVLVLTLLAGCGNSSQTATSDGGRKAEVLSECLSTEKVIAYEVETVDKSETPDNIWFFENGKVTIIPGEEFGLTMGDFAQMTDEEIWSTYETVRETYADNYKTEKVSDYTSSLEAKIMEIEQNIEQPQAMISKLASYLDNELSPYKDMGELPDSYNWQDDNRAAYNAYEDVLSEMYWLTHEWDLVEKYPELNTDLCSQLENEEISIKEAVNLYTNIIENTISEKTDSLTQLQTELDGISTSTCATPFCDMSFSFVVETDASGNNVQSESLVYPTLEYYVGEEAPETFYDSLGFALGLTTQQQIYDTTYNCISLSGSGRFCTRETMETDTIDSKNILIDLSGAEINELFREEVMARYE